MNNYTIGAWRKVQKHRSKCATAMLRMQAMHTRLVDAIMQERPVDEWRFACCLFRAACQSVVNRHAAHTRLVAQVVKL